MKLKILGLAAGATMLGLASTTASAATDIYVGLELGSPAYVERRPVYYYYEEYEPAPVVYYERRYYEPRHEVRYYERHDRGRHRGHHKHKHGHGHHHH